MTTLSTLEAYDAIRFSEQYAERLAAASADLTPRRGLKQEKEWLAAAEALLREAREAAGGLLERARGLPELEEVRGEFAAGFQGHWVDALEKLLAGVTFHIGSRDPVIEALYPHQKFPVLRRASRDVVIEFASDFERRLRSSYVTRILAEPEFAFAGPVVEQIKSAYAKWQSAFSGASLPEPECVELRKELVSAGKRIDLATRQARLLAEAALLPVADAFETHGLSARPRKRASKLELKPVRAVEPVDGPTVVAPVAAVEEKPVEAPAPVAPPAPEPVAAPAAEAAAPAEAAKPPRKRKAKEPAPDAGPAPAAS